MTFIRALFAAIVTAAVLPAPATAQQYPNKPVKIIMPFPLEPAPTP